MQRFLSRWLFVLGAALPLTGRAQAVPQAVIVEHFTNSRCSICFNRNPGFYANLRQQPPATLHVAYHPSAPYAACVFSQQNRAENDARTTDYGIYGSTPRLVVNGQVIPATQSYADPALFTPFQQLTSPLAVQVTLARQGADSLVATVQVQTVAPASVAAPTLYVALVEDTVFYAAPNGELIHPDVFRRSFTGEHPAPISLAAVGSSVTVRRAVATNTLWDTSRLYAIALVQQAGGALVQAGASARLGPPPLGVGVEAANSAFGVYPNPVRETLRLTAPTGAAWEMVDVLGRQVLRGAAATAGIDVRSLPAGTYVLRQPGGPAVRFRKE